MMIFSTLIDALPILGVDMKFNWAKNYLNNYGWLKHRWLIHKINWFGKNLCWKNFLSDSGHLPYTSFFFYNINRILACEKWQILRCFENGINKKIRTKGIWDKIEWSHWHLSFALIVRRVWIKPFGVRMCVEKSGRGVRERERDRKKESTNRHTSIQCTKNVWVNKTQRWMT